MEEGTFTRAQIQGLAEKLDTIDFTDEEKAILQAVFSAAAEEEVSGYMLTQASPLSHSLFNAFQLQFDEPWQRQLPQCQTHCDRTTRA